MFKIKPTDFENNYLVIDTSMDEPIFPEGITHGLNVLRTKAYYDYHPYDQDYSEFPEIDIDEFKSHI